MKRILTLCGAGFALFLAGFIFARVVKRYTADDFATISIVYSPELRGFVVSAVQRFALTNPVLKDGTRVKVKTRTVLPYDTVKRLASGELKVQGWIAPSANLVGVVNHLRFNLGAAQGNCKPLFTTPVVLAYRPEFSSLVATPEGRLRMNLTHASPLTSATGLSALYQLASVAGIEGENLTPQAFAALKNIEANVAAYGSSEHSLLRRVAGGSTKIPLAVETTEQQVIQFNRQKNGDLKAYYHESGSFQSDHALCTSQADWSTPAQRAALELFSDFLTSPESQALAEQEGFRRVDTSAFHPPRRAGSGWAEKLRPAKRLSSALSTELFKRWDELRRPQAVALTLDTSRSLNGIPLVYGRNAFRDIVIRQTNQDLISLVTFATEPKLELSFTTDEDKVLPLLEGVESVGGSAVYDGIRRSFQLFEDTTAEAYRKVVVVYTDGEDANSIISFDHLQHLVEEQTAAKGIFLIVVGVQMGDVDFSDLKAIVSAANGVFIETNPSGVELVSQEVLDLIF